MSSEEDNIGKGATDEGWEDSLEDDDSESEDPAEEIDFDSPNAPGVDVDSTESGVQPSSASVSQPIEWVEFLGDADVAEHAVQKGDALEPPEVDIAPPTHRFLNSKSKALDRTDQFTARLDYDTLDALEETERAVMDEFDDKIVKSVIRDAIIRVGMAHPEEVVAMLGAYGYDFDWR